MTPTSNSLHRLTREHPALAPAAEALRALLAALGDVVVVLPPGVPNLDVARERLRAGIPALAGEPLMDGAALLAAAKVIGARLDSLEGAARAAAALTGERGTLDLDALAACTVAGAWDDVRAVARRLDVDEHALVTLLDHAARPTLRSASAMVRPLLEHVAWSRGSCPTCGAPPILAELRGTEGERMLRCGRCASAWRFPRLVCPACGERDHRRLASLHAEGEAEFRRVDYCDTCRTYVKAVAALEPLDADALLEEDLGTAGLDFVALERGLRR